MSSTIDLNRIAAEMPAQRVQRSPATDLECDRLGLVQAAERQVYRAIKANSGVKSETALARLTGMSDLDTTRAVQNLIHRGIVRRGHSSFAVGAFELTGRK